MSAISGFMGVAVEADNSKQNQKKDLCSQKVVADRVRLCHG